MTTDLLLSLLEITALHQIVDFLLTFPVARNILMIISDTLVGKGGKVSVWKNRSVELIRLMTSRCCTLSCQRALFKNPVVCGG